MHSFLQKKNLDECKIKVFWALPITHGLGTPDEEIAFTARLKINSHSQIFRYGQRIFCLPRQPKFSDFLDLYLHWISIVCVYCIYLMGYFWEKNPYWASIFRDFGHHVRCKGSPNEIDMQYAAYIHRSTTYSQF